MMRCPRCGANVSDWEVRSADQLGASICWCTGLPPGVPDTLANVAYAELCQTDLKQPVKAHDVARFVSSKRLASSNSINVLLSQDRRFCWAGSGLYGLTRHGLIPGARSLAEAAYAILLAAPRELYVEEVDFALEQFNYRFNSESLVHHLRGYTSNRWNLVFQIDKANRVSVNADRFARQEYNTRVRVCPSHAAFDSWIEVDLAPAVERNT